MGSSPGEIHHHESSAPKHPVAIGYRLWVGRFEVSFDEFEACGEDCGMPYPPDLTWGRGKQPVKWVDFEDAQRYVRWLSKKTGKRYRLLSESEWEYAARAGGTGRWHFGDDESALPQYANAGNLNRQVLPVGQFRPNGFGLYDMIGNVAELVADCGGSYKDAPHDGAIAEGDNCKSRYIRGGHYSSSVEELRTARRGTWESDRRAMYVGFRVARVDPDPVLAEARATPACPLDLVKLGTARQAMSWLRTAAREIELTPAPKCEVELAWTASAAFGSCRIGAATAQSINLLYPANRSSVILAQYTFPQGSRESIVQDLGRSFKAQLIRQVAADSDDGPATSTLNTYLGNDGQFIIILPSKSGVVVEVLAARDAGSDWERLEASCFKQ